MTYLTHVNKTKVHENGGKSPAWNQTFEIPLGSVSDEVHFEIRDDEVMGSRVIASAHIKGSALAINGGTREWFSVYHDDKQAGRLHLETKFRAEKH